jgi:hypothetical protein
LKDKTGNSRGEKETWRAGREIIIYLMCGFMQNELDGVGRPTYPKRPNYPTYFLVNNGHNNLGLMCP